MGQKSGHYCFEHSYVRAKYDRDQDIKPLTLGQAKLLGRFSRNSGRFPYAWRGTAPKVEFEDRIPSFGTNTIQNDKTR